jgi:hypothetical protein
LLRRTLLARGVAVNCPLASTGRAGEGGMRTLISLPASRLVFLAGASVAIVACSRSGDSARTGSTSHSDSGAGPGAQASNSDSIITLRGTVVSISGSAIVLKTDTGNATVKTPSSFHVYTRAPSTLAAVNQGTFIGVTSVKQPDGTERATEIHIFPEELRGLGEGSRMMTPDTTGNANRMTNGSVSATPASRMSNGSVASTNGSTIVVQYRGGSQQVAVPPGTSVTELKIAPTNLAAGDQVIVVAKRGSDGSLSSIAALTASK